MKGSACKFYSEFFLILMSISTEHLTLTLKDLFQYLVIIQLTLEVSKGSESWNHPKMTISGDTVGWTGKSTGPASPDGWIALSGNANDHYHGQYLAADGPGFDYSDGCWTFTVTVTHTTHVGESVLIDGDVSWDLDFEDRKVQAYSAEVC